MLINEKEEDGVLVIKESFGPALIKELSSSKCTLVPFKVYNKARYRHYWPSLSSLETGVHVFIKHMQLCVDRAITFMLAVTTERN